ncbi:DUF6220 domain-containing protein [Cohnella pontilimi]|uniref:DUF6220 domain-containing protein n=1 Tax=Cohnella pontilimi TaxID=2564100 RepID=UPI001B80BE09|nr:DUF6220 domain-containing protein [Cohnella pontilimi]
MKSMEREDSKMSNLVFKARIVFTWLARLFAVCIMIQVFLAGLALFWDSARWASHTGFAKFLMIPPILLLITSLVARLPLSLRLRSAGLIGMIALMFVTAKLSSNIGYLAALHPVIAMIMLGQTLSIARMSHALQNSNNIPDPTANPIKRSKCMDEAGCPSFLRP